MGLLCLPLSIVHAESLESANTGAAHRQTSEFRDVVRYLWRDGVNQIASANRSLGLPSIRAYSGPVLGAAAEGPLGFVPQHTYLSERTERHEALPEWSADLYDGLTEPRPSDRAGHDGTLHAAGLAKVFAAGSRFALDIGGGLYQQDNLTGRPELYGFELDAGARWSVLSGVDLYGRMAYREHYFDVEQVGDDLRQDEALEMTVGASYRLNAWQLNAAFRNMDVDSNVPGREFERNRIELNVMRRW